MTPRPFFLVVTVKGPSAQDVADGDALSPVYAALGGLDSGGGVRDYWCGESHEPGSTFYGAVLPDGVCGFVFTVEPAERADVALLTRDLEQAARNLRGYGDILRAVLTDAPWGQA